MTAGVAALIAAEGLPDSYAEIVARWWVPLAARIATAAQAKGDGFVVGINGAQGTGKTTLCRFLELLIAERHGLRGVTLSLDDLYLTRRARAQLGRDVHPLLATRGPPGTHDTRLGAAVLTALTRGSGPVAVPRFDKARDDRVPRRDWPVVAAPVDIVLFEGWCVGAAPQPADGLAVPVNALEVAEDGDGRWREYVNAALAGDYQRLFGHAGLLVMLRPPGWAAVRGWRGEQEVRLRQRTGGGMDDAALDRFVAHYERLTRHMLATLSAIADVVIDFDPGHEVVAATGLA